MDIIVNFAPTGVIPTKAMTPFVPISVQEIIEDVHRAYEIGISMVHLHARDENTGYPTYKADIYAKLISGIRKFASDLIITVSLSGRLYSEFEKRSEPLQLDGNVKPDMGSLTLSSVNFNKEASINAPSMIQALALELQKKNIMPELEAFDVGMVNYSKYLERKGLIIAPHYINLIIGNIACAQANLLHIGMMLNDLPSNSYWSLGGVGDAQTMVNSIAIAIGGGVRIGIEDNIWFDSRRTKLAHSKDFLLRIKELALASGREIMPPSKLRKILHLCPGNGLYGREQT